MAGDCWVDLLIAGFVPFVLENSSRDVAISFLKANELVKASSAVTLQLLHQLKGIVLPQRSCIFLSHLAF